MGIDTLDGSREHSILFTKYASPKRFRAREPLVISVFFSTGNCFLKGIYEF